MQKPVPNLIAHRVAVAAGRLELGAVVDMAVPEWTRRRTQANHTGTHLLHAALRKVLGDSARQMGSLVAPDRLRFDYAAPAPTTPEQIAEIERLVNEEILRDQPVTKEVMAMDEARRKGADMFFGEKYGERVRVVEVPGFSTELCGGCHVPRTGEIGAFKIVSDRGLAAGVRRLEAVTSLGAVELLSQDEQILNALSGRGAGAAREPRRAVGRARGARQGARARGRLAQAEARLRRRRTQGDRIDVGGVPIVTRVVEGLSIPELRNLSDTLRSKLKSGVVVVGTVARGQDLRHRRRHAGPDQAPARPPRSPRASARRSGGSGGGKADLAQAGGKNEALLPGGLKAAAEGRAGPARRARAGGLSRRARCALRHRSEAA